MISALPRTELDLTAVEHCADWLSARRDVDARAIERGLATVSILRPLGMDDNGCIAALLHSIDNVAFLDDDQVREYCNDDTLSLYQAVAKLARLSSFARHDGEDSEVSEDNLRKMLITMVDDVRVVLIKLAEQLCLLREAKDASEREQKRISRSTFDIYAPLANRLGIWQLKWEMEDLALRYRDPAAYHQLAGMLDEKREDRERYIQSLQSVLHEALNETGINAEIYGRPKHIYSIWKKMQLKGLTFENLWDIRAVRIIVDSVSECYVALGIVHTQWRHLAGEFDDYIATPKPNGYRSIHTVVIGPQDKSVEVQIRTREMHDENELGIAAHWRYKENVQRDDGIDRKVLWLRQLLEWKQELEESETASGALREARENSRVYVFTPKGTVIDLPEGATPVDFAYAIHSEVGHSTRGARVNGRMVPLNYALQTGDQVQIQNQKGATPSRDWLRPEVGIVHTQRARSRIQQWFKHQDQGQHIAEGRSMLEKELDRLGLEDISYDRIVASTPYHRPDDLLAALGAGDYKLARALLPFRRDREKKVDVAIESTRPRTTLPRPDSFRIDGVDNLLTTMAKCCQPVPGEPIVGYISTGRGVVIHRQTCSNILRMAEDRHDRLVDVDWGRGDTTSYPVEVSVMATQRTGIFHDISQLLKDSGIEILKVNTRTDDDELLHVMLRLEVSGLTTLSKALDQLSGIPDVLEVHRTKH